MGGFLSGLSMILYLVVGLVQLAAIMAGLTDYFGMHWILAAIIAFFTAYIPLVGSVAGIWGAVSVWEWEWWQAALLFIGPFVFVVATGALQQAAGGLSRREG